MPPSTVAAFNQFPKLKGQRCSGRGEEREKATRTLVICKTMFHFRVSSNWVRVKGLVKVRVKGLVKVRVKGLVKVRVKVRLSFRIWLVILQVRSVFIASSGGKEGERYHLLFLITMDLSGPVFLLRLFLMLARRQGK